MRIGRDDAGTFRGRAMATLRSVTGQGILAVSVVALALLGCTKVIDDDTDGTSGTGSYPAGRFVTLAPIAGGRYRLDFNRSRNPFCAYNAAYPCPAPWRGNTIAVPVAAGERYESHP